MILEFVLSVVGTVLRALFGVLPDLPEAPAWLTTTLDTFIGSVMSGVAFVSYIMTPTIFIFVLSTFLVLLNFEYIYHLVLWIIKKLPIGSH